MIVYVGCRLQEAVVVEGWCSVEELVQYGFARDRVVMANEAHNGPARGRRRLPGPAGYAAADRGGAGAGLEPVGL
jgi:hypothetical protein